MDVLGPDDAGELLTLQRAAYVGEAMIYDQFLPPLTEPLEEIRAVLADAHTTVLGIRERGRLIGVVRIKADGEIAKLAVAPDRQHEGLGSRLLRAAVDRGGSWLFTGNRSDANLRLYGKHGFVETHRVPYDGHELVYLKRPAARPGPPDRPPGEQ